MQLKREGEADLWSAIAGDTGRTPPCVKQRGRLFLLESGVLKRERNFEREGFWCRKKRQMHGTTSKISKEGPYAPSRSLTEKGRKNKKKRGDSGEKKS